MDKTLMQYKKNVFEGYYFKHTFEDKTLSFIVGFSTAEPYSFIQVVESNPMYTKHYAFGIDDMIISNNPFSIKIKNNFFSFEKIIVDLDEYKGQITYTNLIPLESFLIFKNIMGPFVMLPNMKCNHAIISMDHQINVDLVVREHKYETIGRGYIEKDYGKTFPKNYVWIQCNDFEEEQVSIFFSIATIPYMGLKFDGVICNFVLNGEEYRFATYNGSTYHINDIGDNKFAITLKNGQVILKIIAIPNDHAELVSPKNGAMNGMIKEGLNGLVEVSLIIDNKLVYTASSNKGAIELTNHQYFK